MNAGNRRVIAGLLRSGQLPVTEDLVGPLTAYETSQEAKRKPLGDVGHNPLEQVLDGMLKSFAKGEIPADLVEQVANGQAAQATAEAANNLMRSAVLRAENDF